MQHVPIHGEHITLTQLLKKVNIAASGGEVKAWLGEGRITVNNTVEHRRGRKIYPGDVVHIDGYETFYIETDG